MKLFQLIKNVKCRVFGSALVEISGLFHNDKDVQPDGLFFCIDGKNESGENFVKSAVESGAVAIVTKKEIKNLHGITQVLVNNVRRAMSLIACNFYDNPAKKLKIVGVTGTNGKTTTTYMICDMLKNLGKECAVIGTNGAVFCGKKIDTGMTTPDPIELQKLFYKMVQNGVQYVCMEASAHAIYLHKLDGFVFDLIIFTNLTEDHLDYFKTMENYFNAKKSLFVSSHAKAALINVDDKYGRRIYESINITKFTYSMISRSDFQARNLGIKNFKQSFKLSGKIFETIFWGGFNIYNLTAAIVSIEKLGLKVKDSQKLINSIKPVAGRFNTIIINKKLFIVDFAHTPDGLENVLKLCKTIVKDKKLYCIFGCGGNRETQKRLKMGEISSKYADLTIISTDNPRFESRESIAKEIEKGVTNSNYIIILDRAEAIKYAYKNSNEGDVILVAGKGAEDYIDEQGVKTKYSDFDEIEKLEK